jgi:hypothetical protein
MPPKHVEEAKRIADEHDAEVAGQPPAGTEGPAADVVPGEPPAPPAPDLAPPAPEPDDGDWQQKYQTLKGKYDSEMPRLSGELRETRGQLNEVLNRLNQMDQQPQHPAPPPPPPPPPAAPLVTEEDIENFGPELADFIRRQATVVADSLTAGLKEENAQLRQQVEQVGATTGQAQVDRYLTRLKELVPDYEAINVDQGFLNWLGEMDPMAGVPRQAFLNTAFEARDPDRTAKLFTAYKEAAGVTPPPPPPAPPAPRNGGNGGIPPGLETQISPNAGSGGGAPPSGDPDQIWSAADIRNFTNDILRGTYKGRETEQEAIQAAIDSAILEGRVRA